MDMELGNTGFAGADSLTLSRFMNAVYLWMAIGLALSGGIAWAAGTSEAYGVWLAAHPGAFTLMIIGELVLVIGLSMGARRFSALTLMAGFTLYSALNGLTLATIFMIYTSASIAQVFGVAAIMFLALSIYGALTRRNLAVWGGFLFMSLIGIIVASLVNLFLHSPMIDWITAYAGVVVFSGLIAYDTQKLRAIAAYGAREGDMMKKMALFGALSLYLDFINLFLSLLRVMGHRR